MTAPNHPTHEHPEDAAGLDEQRRAALIKLAAWTPPVIVTLTLSKRATAESLPGPPDDLFPT